MSVVTVAGREMPFWLGRIPSSWEVVPTKRVMTVVKQTPGRGKTDEYDRLSLTMQGVLPRSKDDRNGLQPVDFDAYQILRPGQLVFKLIDLMNVSTSRVGLSQHTGLVSPAYIVVSPGPKAEARFAHYYFRDLYSRRIFNLLGSVGVRSSLGPRDLMALEFLLPPLDEQRAIADYLDQETAQIDALVAKQEEFIGLLRERKDSIADFEFQRVDGRRTPTVRQTLVLMNRLPAAGSGVVTAYRDGIVTLRENRRTDGYTMSAAEHGYQGVVPGDLVFHALDGFAGAVGISDSAGQCSPVYHVCRPRYDDDPEYLALLLRYMGTSGFLATQAPSTRQRSVDFRNWATFARVPLQLPAPLQQREYVASFKRQAARIDTLIAKANEHIALAKERRSALITAAVTGQLDVRTARRGA